MEDSVPALKMISSILLRSGLYSHALRMKAVSCCAGNDKQCSADVGFPLTYIENEKLHAAALRMISSVLLTSTIWSFMAVQSIEPHLSYLYQEAVVPIHRRSIA